MSIKLYTLPWLKSGSGELSKKKIEAKNIINLLSESLDTNQLLSLYEKIKKIDSIYLKKLSKIKLLNIEFNIESLIYIYRLRKFNIY
mgnify:CR=1 FL=1